MQVQQAVESLWKAGYRANASNVLPGRVVIADPVLTCSGSTQKTEFKRVEIHASQVAKFISDRS